MSDSEPEFESEFSSTTEQQLPPRASEQALIDYVASTNHALFEGVNASHCFCTSLGRGQLPSALSQTFPLVPVTCNFLDLHAARLAAETLRGRPRVAVTCEPDPPVADQSCGLVALPLTAHGDAEWTQELLETASRLLCPGGILIASSDNPDDRWLREQIQRRLGRVAAQRTARAIVYRATLHEPPRKSKNHVCWFAFRDGARILRVASRPGVFSHRRLDTGARALIEAMHVETGQRVIEFGCGSGAVSLAAAARAEAVKVLAIDANPRAVQCTQWGAEANGMSPRPTGGESLTSPVESRPAEHSFPAMATSDERRSVIQTSLDADAGCDRPKSYDVALANPPYYSKHRIARLFAAGAARALRTDGIAYFVTKDATWYVEHLPEWFDQLEIQPIRDYLVISGRRADDH